MKRKTGNKQTKNIKWLVKDMLSSQAAIKTKSLSGFHCVAVIKHLTQNTRGEKDVFGL